MKKNSRIQMTVAQRKCHWLLSLVFLLLSLSFPARSQTLEWAKYMPGVDKGAAIEVDMDRQGNVYIVGWYEDTTDFDPGPGSATLSVFDPSGSNQDAFLAKYNAAGNLLWVKRVMTNTKINFGLAIDTAGNAYVTGGISGTSYFETASGIDSFTTGSTSVGNIFLTKYTSSGDFVWAKSMPDLSLGHGGTGEGCAVDRSGNVYITGFYTGLVDFNPGGTGGALTSESANTNNESNLFLAKYDPNGTYIWAGGVGGTGYAQGLAITVDTNGSVDQVCLTGFFVDTMDFDMGTGVANLIGTDQWNAFLAKYDTAGEYVWAKGLKAVSAPNNRNQGLDIAVDTNANVLLTGFMIGSADFDPGQDSVMLTGDGLQNMFLAKYNSAGEYIWAQNVHGAGSLSQGASLTVDQIGNAYVCGIFGFAAADFDPGPDTVTLLPGGFVDIIVAKYGSCGKYISAVNLKGSLIGYGNDIVLNATGDAYITGRFGGTVDFDPGAGTDTLTAATENIYLTKLNFGIDSIPTSLLTETICSDSFVLNDIVYTSSGIYKQVVPGTVDCDSVIILDLTISEMIEPIITVNVFTLSLTQTYVTYQWLKDSVILSGETNSTLDVTENGFYQVIVTNEVGCVDTSMVYEVNNVDIADVHGWSKQIRVWPNPTRKSLHIQSPVPVSAILYNIEGRVVLKQKNAGTLSLEDLAAGMYMLQCTDAAGRVIKNEKVVKQP